MAQLINNERDMEVCGQSDNPTGAVLGLEQSSADVVILDISLNGKSGLDLVREVRCRFPEVKVLMLSMHDQSTYAQRALRDGASGYIMKHEATDTVLTAIRRVLAGDVYISPEMAATILHRLTGLKTGVGGVTSASDRQRFGPLAMPAMGA